MMEIEAEASELPAVLAYYFDINIGKWDKDYVVEGSWESVTV